MANTGNAAEKEYDFVIVGAGSAGCVLANRLSGLPQTPSVCIIELGPSNTDGRWNVAIPAATSYSKNNENSRDLWLQYRSEPIKQLYRRRIDCSGGKGWGGTSAVNSMQFVRGQPHDFDRWATEDYCGPLWTYDMCLPFFKKLETFTPGFDFSDSIDSDAERECAVHLNEFRGFDGPMKVTNGRLINRHYSKCAYYPAFIRAAMQAGHKFNPDLNGAVQEGVSWMDTTTFMGLRQSASRCYLSPAFSRKNLTIISEARVSRVVLEDKKAIGVDYIDARDREHFVKASKEVILCCGTYNSPHLLMLSGIGDPSILEPVGIDTLHELRGVGRNLQDHLFFRLKYATRRPEFSFTPGDWKNDWATRMKTQWEATKDGWGASNAHEACIFFKSNGGLMSPNMKCVLSPAILKWTEGELKIAPGMTFGLMYTKTISVGHVSLKSKNPEVPPMIVHNYLSEPKELREFTDGLKSARKVAHQPALSEFIGDELFPGSSCLSSASIHNFIVEGASSSYQPCGTCRMGDPETAPTPEAAGQVVVDAELRVFGLKGLRVVDGSVIPSITSGSLNAPILMIAERAAEFIAATYYS